MTGWRTDTKVTSLRDAIIGMLKAADPDVRQHAWYWISFEMEIIAELDTCGPGSGLPEEALQWLLTQPKRLAEFRDIQERAMARQIESVEQTKKQLERLNPK